MRSTGSSMAGDGALAAALLRNAQTAVLSFVDGETLDEAAAAAFGPGVTGAAVAATVHGFLRKGWPTLELVDEDTLGGARGAYSRDSNTIYLSREFLAAAAPAAVTAVLVEEIGHAIDAAVNTADAAGDEGDIFARFVAGNAPDAGTLAALHAENDHSTIVVDGHAAAVELAGPVVGTITLDGSLADWSANDVIDRSLSTNGYNIYGKTTGGSFVFALQAPVAIGQNTTAWLNTDQNTATGFKIFGSTGGAEFNVNFDASGVPHLYTGNAGATLVSGVTVSFGFSADRKIVEFAVPSAALGNPQVVGTLWDVNDSVFLPSDFAATQYNVTNTASLPQRTDFSKHIGIVYSETSAAKLFGLPVETAKTVYSQLFMAAQNQAAMAGVHYDILTETDLTNLSKLANYDALLFPGFQNVQASQVSSIESTLKLAVQNYHIGLIAASNFMTNNENGAALSGDAYARMKSLLDIQPTDGGFPATVTINAANVTHPMMQDYSSGETIRTYTNAGWNAYSPVDPAGTTVLATENVNGRTLNAVIATNTGGRNIHFASEAVMGDNNLLWQAVDYAVNGSGISAGLQLSRNKAVLATRNDMDLAFAPSAVDPEDGSPGIYDKLVPILQHWKSQYNFVGSYYLTIGDAPPDRMTDWSVSGNYYKQLLAMGNEIGSHTISHPFDTNSLSAAQIQHEFQGAKQIIEQQMSALLGRPFTVEGAAVPGNPENLTTSLRILQYYDYMSGGASLVGSGYPGALGYLNPAMAAADKVYLAPDVDFDFSLVEFQHMTPAQASAVWASQWASLLSHADVPIVVWPIHDYSITQLAEDPGVASPYLTSMFTDFIARAYAAGTEFVTLADLADRISGLNDSSTTWSVSGSTVTATVTSTDAGRFALDLDNLGTQKIASVANWYAYDEDSVFLDRDAGTFTITLGATPANVTHITALPMRAELVSLSGNGTNLTFTLIGEGDVVIDLAALAGRTPVVTGATVQSLSGEILTLDVGAIGTHNVSVTLGTAPGNSAPTITSNGGGATATVSVAENTTAVTTVTATDPDSGQSRTFSISGGADAAKFAINATSGALSFLAAPNFEAPTDAGANNGYVVDVRVTDSGSPSLTDTQTITVIVTDVPGVTRTGDTANNALQGTLEADSLFGLGGSDVLIGLGGNDTLNGGTGVDTARFSGLSSAYSVHAAGSALTVSGPDGVDTLFGVERLQFDDILVRAMRSPGDFNADGNADVLWRKNDGTMASWNLTSSGTTVSMYGSISSAWSMIDALGDYNGDGVSDVLWRHTDGSIFEWRMNPGGGATGLYLPTLSSSWQMIDGTSDRTGDGTSDVLWRHSNGSVLLWTMDGGNVSVGYVSGDVATSWQIADSRGDYNADGKADVLWRHTDGSVYIWQMGAGNAVTGRDLTAMSTSWSLASGAGDHNGDGTSDLLWRHTNGSTQLWQMHSGSGFDVKALSSVTADAQFVESRGDYNGDGQSDILWRHSNGTLDMWLMDRGNATVKTFSVDNSWVIADAVSDRTGDGISDVLWRSTDATQTQLFLWHMDGNGNVQIGTYVGSPMPSEWHML